jgi:ABC-type spermidine/putrescine transport system permease subunit I
VEDLGLVYGYIPYLIMVLYAGLDRIDGSRRKPYPAAPLLPP